MSFESLTLENYGLELIATELDESDDSDEEQCYGDKCISAFRLLLDDIQAKNSGEGHATPPQVLTSDPNAQSILCPPPADQQDKTCNDKTLPTIPASSAIPLATTAADQRAMGTKGGASATGPFTAASPRTQLADQQFSSANVDREEPQPQVVIRHRPVVPPKPQIDLIRYSMANAKDDLDLDTILSELLELENQLSGDGADQMLMGITPLVQPSSSSNQLNAQATKTNEINAPNPLRHDAPVQRRNLESTTLKGNFVMVSRANQNTEICASPDIDSAYGDSSSTESSGRNRNRNSEISSAGSYGGSLNTPSPTNQGSPKSAGSTNELENQPPLTKPMTDAEIKAAKIKEALEKMKEAKMKKIYVKFFLEDNSTKGLLIDERWSVLDTMKQLAQKLGIVLTPEHAIVEEYPELHIRRIYEDHEYLVENIEDWLADSMNKLYFIRRMDKYCFVHKPERYLLTEKIEFEFPASNSEWTSQQRSDLLQKYLENENLVPELEGWLMLKADGRKSWKKHYFVLRSSGLYYCPKGNKRSAKDLQCLMNVYNNQVYSCTDWRKKYKAPSNFGFAIKHPKIQVKTSKYIKYICTEDENSFRRWMTALRIVKNGCTCLEKNFRTTLNDMQKTALSKPIHVDTQSQIHQRLPILEFHTNSSNGFPTRPQTAQSVNSVNSIHSRQTELANGHTAFDQDNCGTIKRQPGADPLCNSLSTSTFNSNLYIQRSSNSPVLISTSNNSSIHSSSSRNQPVLAEVHTDGFSVATTYPKTVNFVNCGDLDSDEEHFPPPPEILPKLNGSTPASNAVYQNGHDVQRNSQHSFGSPVPPPTQQNVQFRNGFQATKPPPILTPKPTLSQPPKSALKAAPPPPKRSENTKLQSPSLMNDQHKQQMDLFNELQYKIRQKQQIDTN